MTDKKSDGLKDEGFAKFFEARGKQGAVEVEKRRSAEAQAHQAIDGRISSTVDRKGFVQLNVRVPVDIKNLVIEERSRRKGEGSDRADVGDIVAEALQAYLEKP